MWKRFIEFHIPSCTFDDSTHFSKVHMTSSSSPSCSFCGKVNAEVNRLIEGSEEIHICDECVILAAEILAEEGLINIGGQTKRPAGAPGRVPSPKEIVAYLDDYVIGQKRAKKVLSVAVYNHYKRVFGPNGPLAAEENADGGSEKEPTLSDVAKRQATANDDIELTKSNVLLIGPTGSGKTLLAATLAKMLDVPFTIADATTLTEAGYVGEDVETILSGLLQAADWDPERAAYGIIYLDEIDKIARKSGDNPSITRDVSGEGVQQALLKIIEGTVANVPPGAGRKHPQQEFVQLDTSNILFICGGAFSGLAEDVRKRVHKKSSLGFVPVDSFGQPRLPVPAATDVQDDLDDLPEDLTEREREMRIRRNEKESRDESRLLRQVVPDDLLSHGLIPEFIGRLPVIVNLSRLDRETMVRILTEPKNSVVRQYQHLFDMDDVALEFEDDALEAVATEAFLRRTGARGLRSIVEDALLDVMYEIPGREDIARCVVTKGVIADDESPQLFGTKGQPISLVELQAAA